MEVILLSIINKQAFMSKECSKLFIIHSGVTSCSQTTTKLSDASILKKEEK